MGQGAGDRAGSSTDAANYTGESKAHADSSGAASKDAKSRRRAELNGIVSSAEEYDCSARNTSQGADWRHGRPSAGSSDWLRRQRRPGGCSHQPAQGWPVRSGRGWFFNRRKLPGDSGVVERPHGLDGLSSRGVAQELDSASIACLSLWWMRRRWAAASLEAPWPYEIVRPNLDLTDMDADALILHGFVNKDGHFEKLEVAFPDQFMQAGMVLNVLNQWQFRPAKQNGQMTPVEVLLIIPASTN